MNKNVQKLQWGMPEPTEIRRILFPIDGTDALPDAAKYAVRLARSEGAELVCVSIIGRPHYAPRHTPSAQTILAYYTISRRLAMIEFAKVKEMAAKNNVSVRTKILIDISESFADAVMCCADSEKADFIVIGIRKTSTLKRLTKGNIANRLVSRAHCPVLVVGQS